MKEQQLGQSVLTPRRTFGERTLAAGFVAVVATLALAAALAVNQPSPAIETAPDARPAARPTAVSFGTGSVHDGGAYGVRPIARPTAVSFGTGSVYDGQ